MFLRMAPFLDPGVSIVSGNREFFGLEEVKAFYDERLLGCPIRLRGLVDLDFISVGEESGLYRAKIGEWSVLPLTPVGPAIDFELVTGGIRRQDGCLKIVRLHFSK